MKGEAEGCRVLLQMWRFRRALGSLTLGHTRRHLAREEMGKVGEASLTPSNAVSVSGSGVWVVFLGALSAPLLPPWQVNWQGRHLEVGGLCSEHRHRMSFQECVRVCMLL